MPVRTKRSPGASGGRPLMPLAGASAAVVALLVALLVATGCGATGRVAEGEGSVARGKQLFMGEGQCAGCHRLADAGSTGNIGPDLDESIGLVREQGFEESSIRNHVRAQIAYPVENPPTGEQGMPANLVTGEDAASVARYVASVAGLPVAETPEDGEEVLAGDQIFTANCATCHTLAAARSAGTVGPNLDDVQPSVEQVVQIVTNGRGGMPSFEGRLSEEQIQNVATFVAENAG